MREVDTEFECVSRQENGAYGRALLFTDGHVWICLADGRTADYDNLLEAYDDYTIY